MRGLVTASNFTRHGKCGNCHGNLPFTMVTRSVACGTELGPSFYFRISEWLAVIKLEFSGFFLRCYCYSGDDGDHICGPFAPSLVTIKLTQQYTTQVPQQTQPLPIARIPPLPLTAAVSEPLFAPPTPPRPRCVRYLLSRPVFRLLRCPVTRLPHRARHSIAAL